MDSSGCIWKLKQYTFRSSVVCGHAISRKTVLWCFHVVSAKLLFVYLDHRQWLYSKPRYFNYFWLRQIIILSLDLIIKNVDQLLLFLNVESVTHGNSFYLSIIIFIMLLRMDVKKMLIGWSDVLYCIYFVNLKKTFIVLFKSSSQLLSVDA